MTDGPDSPAPEPAGAASQTAADAEKKRRKKREKVRSAWISFVGRIVAQIVGAVATIVLGVLFLQKYGDKPPPAESVSVEPAPARATARPSSDTGEKVLVVLPLDNFSADPKEQYFADGMTEALIASLAQIRSLRVISRTSAMQYKGTRKALHEIVRELNVDLALEGSIVREANRLRLTAQLIDARADEHLWARTYDRTTRDVLAVQAELAAEIAKEVSAASSPGLMRAAPETSVDPAGYDLYLKGREALHLRSPESLRAAEQHFQNALARDSRCSGSSRPRRDLRAPWNLRVWKPDSAGDDAASAGNRQACHRARPAVVGRAPGARIRAPPLPVGLAARRAHLPTGNRAQSQFVARESTLCGVSRRHEPVRGRCRARATGGGDRSPVSKRIPHAWNGALPWPALSARSHGIPARFEPRAAIVGDALHAGMEPHGARRLRGALRTCGAAPRTSNRDQVLAAEAYAAAKGGQASRALQIRNELRSRGAAVAPRALIRVNSGMGDVNALFEAVSRALDERADVMTWLLADPVFDPIRADPRFVGILR